MLDVKPEQVQAFVGYAAAGLLAVWQAWFRQRKPKETDIKLITPNKGNEADDSSIEGLRKQFDAWRTDQLTMHRENQDKQDAVLGTLNTHRMILDRILMKLAGLG